jgi:hypothetical protein
MQTALREAGIEAEERDKRAAAFQDQLYGVTVKMAWVAGLTLAAAIASVIVAFLR